VVTDETTGVSYVATGSTPGEKKKAKVKFTCECFPRHPLSKAAALRSPGGDSSSSRRYVTANSISLKKKLGKDEVIVLLPKLL
jgi:hypothetical protein